jgi:hypothetical protein
MMKSYVAAGVFFAWILSFCIVSEKVYAAVEQPPLMKSQKLQSLEQFWINQFGSSNPLQLNKSKSTKSSLAAQATPIQPSPWATTELELLAKAPADECYYGMGNSGNGPLSAANLPACTGGQPKVNQSYVWGLVKNGDNVWFGTIANTHCLVMGSYLGLSIPNENLSWVCEFGNSTTSPLPASLRDFRAPKVYIYDTATDTPTDKTPLISAAGAPHTTRLNATIGLRSAGTIGDLVILAGPSLAGSINLFAFNGSTGAFINSTTLSAFNDIRKWLVVNGVLYTTVGNSGSCAGGSVLRWTGTVANPFTYDIVGNLDSMGAELALHEGRLFVATWPGCALAGLYMSPTIPAGGLTNANAGGWTKVWKADDYEPDPTVAGTYGGGALYSYKGDLYWGTMHVPFLATVFAAASLDLDADGSGGVDANELLTTALGTYRAINIFRGRNFATTPQLEVLYGLQYLPVYDSGTKSYTIAADPLHQNKMPDPVPKWGLPGFGNFFNVYTWSMAEYNDKLFIGTFDWSYLLAQGFLDIGFDSMTPPPLPPQQAQIIADLYNLMNQYQVQFPWYVWGADLYRIESSSGPAMPEDVAGLGNFANYGIRNMIHGSGLYIGMANPMNLLTDPNDELPEGGWELISLQDPYPIPTMTEWGMIIFVILAGLGAVYYLRRQRRVKN